MPMPSAVSSGGREPCTAVAKRKQPMGHGYRRDTGKRTTAEWTGADTSSIMLQRHGSGKTDQYTFIINFPARTKDSAAQNQYLRERHLTRQQLSLYKQTQIRKQNALFFTGVKIRNQEVIKHCRRDAWMYFSRGQGIRNVVGIQEILQKR
jgi:hypothetical protein